MNRNIIIGAVAVVAVFAGVLYFAGDRDVVPGNATPAANEVPAAEAVKPAGGAPQPVSRSVPPSRPVATDPRLAALMSSPNNAQIEYLPDPEGRVIEEIDNDPHSTGFRKPLRQYTYAGDKIIKLVSYRYLGDQVQIVTADVVYKPDGSVDRYEESTRYEDGKAGRNGG